MDNDVLFGNYLKGLASSGKTRTNFSRFAQDFLDYVDGDFSRERINAYMEHLRREHHYSDGSVNFAFRVVRTLFSRNEDVLKKAGFDWPYRRGEAPSIREDRVQAPALHPATIGRAITAVKENGTVDEKAFLALSTIYGLRRVEMLELDERDVRVKDKTIHIATAKHGRERTHLIPKEIVPYLRDYNFHQERSEFFLFSLWYQIENRIGLPHTNKVGWHSIRRSLNTMLLRKLPEATVMSYLRWKQRTSSHMPFRYSAQRFVSEEGEKTEVVGDALDVDTTVFEAHPFLEFWR
jgi:integrase